MSDFVAYFYIGLGVLVAVLYPIIVGAFKRQFAITKGVPPWLIKYAVLLVFCAFTAFIVLVVYRASHPDTELHFYTAVMLGFGWESSVEKNLRPHLGPQSRGFHDSKRRDDVAIAISRQYRSESHEILNSFLQRL